MAIAVGASMRPALSAAPPAQSVVLMWSAVGAVVAQQNPQEAIHLFVDARYGSDDLALGTALAPSWNPDGPNTINLCGTPNTAIRPNEVIHSSGAPLRHVPVAFRTISAALRYIGSTPQRAGLPPGTPPLPYPPNPQPGQTVVWGHAIVHLLPGLYAPTTTGTRTSSPTATARASRWSSRRA